jgi:hypothetical protein
MASMLKTTPSKKMAAKSHRRIDFHWVSLFEDDAADLSALPKSVKVALEPLSVCKTEATVRVLLLKTASRFIK